ncbi:membrane protein [Actinorhabdospora filicis]|uniref:Membrane protein n=1 Tax=Actinorhabdospora filicis TaxID=1785913 RepID=A0A9W6W6M5_9ACTN|nr:DUF1269 domain-containing protein [Actinorhabdospora filicis]GLZ81712.1 membrane protein [Actinorhabdospora filicis]
MSYLVAVAYPDPQTAQTVLGKLVEMQKEELIKLEDAVVVERRGDGSVKLRQTSSNTAIGATGGALWGGLIGLLFFAPLLGMAVGAAAGAAGGAMTDTGIDDGFMKNLGNELQPGGAALVILVQSATEDKVLDRLGQYGGSIIQTSLDSEAEQHLREAVAARQAEVAQRV